MAVAGEPHRKEGGGAGRAARRLTVLVLLAGAVVWFFWNDARDDLELRWRLDGGESAAGRSWRPQVWGAGDTIAVGGPDEVTGRGALDGVRRWSIPLPAVCAASARPDGGRVAVLFGASPACGRVAVIDLAGGGKAWERELPPVAEKISYPQVVIAEETVVVDWSTGTAAFSLADGGQRWTTRGLAPDCVFDAFASGPVLLATQLCGERSSRRTTLHRLDPETGRALWDRPLPDGLAVRALPPVDGGPPVVGVGPGAVNASSVEAFWTLDAATGDIRTRIPATHEKMRPCAFPDLADCRGLVIADGTLYAATPRTKEEQSGTIAAIDLSTGRERWRTAHSEPQPVTPVAHEDGRLRAVQYSGHVFDGHREPAKLLTIDPASGRIDASETFGRPLQKTVYSMLRITGRLHYAADAIVLVDDLSTGPGTPAILVFGLGRGAD